MWVERAIFALWFFSSAAVAWVWLRPMHEGPLPPMAARPVKPRPHPEPASLAPTEEEGGEEPAAVQPSAPSELLKRRDLEMAMERVKPHVLACREVEHFDGLATVRLSIGRSGNVQSLTFLPPVEHTATAECMRKALRGLGFPRFRSPYLSTIEWTYPFLFKEAG